LAGDSVESLSLGTALYNLAGLQGLISPVYGSNGPLWSLSVELQLYAVYPIVFYIFRVWNVKSCVIAMLGFSVVAALLNATLWPSLIWFGPYWFCWTIGVLIAEIEAGKTEIKINRGRVIVWVLISVAGFFLWLGRWNALAFTFMGCFWGVTILWCLRKKNFPGFCSLPLRLMGMLGIFSYSLYAVHAPVCLFARSYFLSGKQSESILIVIPVIIACISVAFCLFILVERYTLRVPKWLRNAIGFK